MRQFGVRRVEPRIEFGFRRFLIVPARHGKPVEFAFEAERLALPGQFDDVQALPEQGLIDLLIAPVGLRVEIAVHPVVEAANHAELDAAFAHVIQHRDVLRDADRMPVGQADAALTELQPRRLAGGEGVEQDRVGRYGIGPAIPEEMMLGGPNTTVAVGFQDPQSLGPFVDRWIVRDVSVMSQQAAVESHTTPPVCCLASVITGR